VATERDPPVGLVFAWRNALCRILNVVVATERDPPIQLRGGRGSVRAELDMVSSRSPTSEASLCWLQ